MSTLPSSTSSRKRQRTEPSLLHEHADLRLGTLFREHTTLGETFEHAVSQILGPSHSHLVHELRVQFGASIDAVCDDLEQEDTSLNGRLKNHHRNDGQEPPQKQRYRHKPTRLHSKLQELSGLRGTFHYQTSPTTTLTTPSGSTEFVLPSNAEEKLKVSKGYSLQQARNMVPATTESFQSLTRKEINGRLEKVYKSSACPVRYNKTEALERLVQVHNDRIVQIGEGGYVEQIGSVDIWCAKA